MTGCGLCYLFPFIFPLIELFRAGIYAETRHRACAIEVILSRSVLEDVCTLSEF